MSERAWKAATPNKGAGKKFDKAQPAKAWTKATPSKAAPPQKTFLRFPAGAPIMPADLVQLQQVAGNAAVQQLLKERVSSQGKADFKVAVPDDQKQRIYNDDAEYGRTPNETKDGASDGHFYAKSPNSEKRVYDDDVEYGRTPNETKDGASDGHFYAKSPSKEKRVYDDDVDYGRTPNETKESSDGHFYAKTSNSVKSAPVSVDSTPKANKGEFKYGSTKSRQKKYEDEFESGSHFLPSFVDGAKDEVDSGKFASLDEAMQAYYGWTQEDCDKNLHKVKNIYSMNPDKPLVAKLDDQQREDYELRGKAPFVQGNRTEPYDTSTASTNFSGKGFAIFVMSPNGQLYAGSHKVGLFHHSSFLSGGNVAGAGEVKVDKGRLKYLTNKSGHYLPSAEEMVQVMSEFEQRGVNLGSVTYRHMTLANKAGDEYGAKEFYDSYKDNASNAPH